MNPRMTLAIVIAVVSVLAGASSQLDPLIGVAASKSVVAACNLLSAILASVMAVISTQSSTSAAMAADPSALAQTIRQTPGVELTVNKNADPALAALAMSPENNKIVAKPGQESVLQALASTTK